LLGLQANCLSFNDVIRPEQNGWRDRQREGLSSRLVDNQLEARWFLNGKLAWSRPLQELAGIERRTFLHVGDVGAVPKKATRVHEHATGRHRDDLTP